MLKFTSDNNQNLNAHTMGTTYNACADPSPIPCSLQLLWTQSESLEMTCTHIYLEMKAGLYEIWNPNKITQRAKCLFKQT